MNIVKKPNIQALIMSVLSFTLIAMPTVSAANNYNDNKHHNQRAQNAPQPKHITKRIKHRSKYSHNRVHRYQPRHPVQYAYSRSHSVYAEPPAVVYSPPHRFNLHNLNLIFGLPSPNIGIILRH